MPCQDQTEQLELVIDGCDCVKTFALRKMTCGQTVGEQILAPYIQGMTVDALLSGSLQDVVVDLDVRPPLEEFLLFKQFFSIRAALLVWTGAWEGVPSSSFVLESMEYEAEETTLRGQVAVDLISEEIKSCGSCKSCRTIPKKPETNIPDEQGAPLSPVLEGLPFVV